MLQAQSLLMSNIIAISSPTLALPTYWSEGTP